MSRIKVVQVKRKIIIGVAPGSFCFGPALALLWLALAMLAFSHAVQNRLCGLGAERWPGGIYRWRLRAVYAPRSVRRYISTEASSRLRAEASQEVYIDGRFERFRRRGWPGGIYRRRLRAVYAPRPARRYISTEASSRLRAEAGQEVYIDGGVERFRR